jgi:hypothetical protein
LILHAINGTPASPARRCRASVVAVSQQIAPVQLQRRQQRVAVHARGALLLRRRARRR